MPGRSLTRPPRMSTTECSWRLCPIPGMYAVTSMPLVSRTRAILRRAELGFLGVVVFTCTHTPRFWGLRPRAGDLLFPRIWCRPSRTSWLTVGMSSPPDRAHEAPATPLGGPGRGGEAPAAPTPPVEAAPAGLSQRDAFFC